MVFGIKFLKIRKKVQIIMLSLKKLYLYLN